MKLRPGDFTSDGCIIDRNGTPQRFGTFYLAQGRENAAKRHGWSPSELCEGGQFIAEKHP